MSGSARSSDLERDFELPVSDVSDFTLPSLSFMALRLTFSDILECGYALWVTPNLASSAYCGQCGNKCGEGMANPGCSSPCGYTPW